MRQALSPSHWRSSRHTLMVLTILLTSRAAQAATWRRRLRRARAAPHSLWQPASSARTDSRRECVVACSRSAARVGSQRHIHKLQRGFGRKHTPPHTRSSAHVGCPLTDKTDAAHDRARPLGHLDHHRDARTVGSIAQPSVCQLLVRLALFLLPTILIIDVALLCSGHVHSITRDLV